MAVWWMEGGVWMWAVLALALVGLLTVGLSVLVALTARLRGGGLGIARVLAVVSVFCASAPAFTGLSAWLQNRALVDEALAHADPALAVTLRAVGYREARRPFEFGGMTSAPLALLSAVALVVALPPTRKPRTG